MKQAAAVLLALGMLTTVAPSASASPVIYIDTNHFVGTGVLHAPGTLANGLNVYLGAVQITGDLGTFWSYCVDLQHYDLAGANEVTVASMSDWNNIATRLPCRRRWAEGPHPGCTTSMGRRRLEAHRLRCSWPSGMCSTTTMPGF